MGSILKEKAEEIEDLVLLVQKGDKEAFSDLYNLLIDPIFRYVYYKVNQAEVDDIVETVFLKVWENIKQYKPQKKSFSAWVFRIAHNLVIDHYRSSKTFDELDYKIADYKREHNPIKTTEDTLEQNLLRRAMGKLKDNYREFLIYKFVNDLSNREIAQMIGKSEGSLRILQFRALKALKQELEEMGAARHL
ncbi:RNA polymerase sigma factor [Patescibacteria group bacterium]|nr:RNA polymerase sigma factor [Patescibacteria group bacterium]